MKLFTRPSSYSFLIGHFTNLRYFSKTCTAISEQSSKLKTDRINIQKRLVEILHIKPIKALEIFTSCKKYSEISSLVISNNYKLCVLNKLSKDLVLKYPYILIENELSKKIKILKTLEIKLTDSLPMVKLPLQRLNWLASKDDATNTRIYDIGRIFNISLNETCEILATKPFLFAVNLQHLESLLKLLMENGFPKEDIVKDMWVFKYSDSFIRTRLQCIKEHKVEPIKTWMLRCPEETLYKRIKRESDNRDILGENSVAEYLSERLKCSENVAKNVIRKQPALQTKSLLKMNEMIDCLYKHGFTASQICRFPKVLLHSTKTANNRIKELNAIGTKPDSLYILTKSQKQYMQYIETLTKAKVKVKTV